MIDDMVMVVVYFFDTLKGSVRDGVIGKVEMMCDGKRFASVGFVELNIRASVVETCV